MINLEIKGFDNLDRQLREAKRALEALNGDLVQLKFDPANPDDVNRAIKEMERIVDQKMAVYRSNPFIEPFINASKKAFREQILKHATDHRSGSSKAPGALES